MHHMQGLTAGNPEIVDGIEKLRSPTPTCKSVPMLGHVKAASGGSGRLIDEEVRLLIQIETLFPLQSAFWLYGTTDADHG